MVCNTHYYYASGLCPSSGFLQTENTTFQKLDLFPSSGEGGGTYSTEKPKACLSTGNARTIWHRLWKGQAFGFSVE
jgi:hypothetical protein